MSWTSTGIVKRRAAWAVQVRSDDGEERELKYRTEAQARYFAAVLALGPARLPEPPKLRIKRKLASLSPPRMPGAGEATGAREATPSLELDVDAALDAVLGMG